MVGLFVYLNPTEYSALNVIPMYHNIFSIQLTQFQVQGKDF